MTRGAALPGPESTARRTLLWGVGALVLGIGLVGTGAPKEGALPVLAGLLLTIFGIHTYGRLGPDPVVAEDAHRSVQLARIWRGGLVALAGGVVLAGGGPTDMASVTAYLAVFGGVLGAILGTRGLSAGSPPGAGRPTESKRRKAR